MFDLNNAIHGVTLFSILYFYIVIHIVIYRKKFRSQTSDNMER
jgi:hypothetical protein